MGRGEGRGRGGEGALPVQQVLGDPPTEHALLRHVGARPQHGFPDGGVLETAQLRLLTPEPAEPLGLSG